MPGEPTAHGAHQYLRIALAALRLRQAQLIGQGGVIG